MDAAVRELLAKQAITEQLYNYCRSMDRLDAELGARVWHEDGSVDYGAPFRGTGAGFIAFVLAYHRTVIAHSHQLANILIRIDGERAVSEAYVTAVLRRQDAGGLVEITIRGRYLDRWSCRAGRWAIDQRVYVHDLDDVRPITGESMQCDGRRDPSDPSYAVLRLAD